MEHNVKVRARQSNQAKDKVSMYTYELVLLEVVDEHLTRFLIAQELCDLIENEQTHQD